LAPHLRQKPPFPSKEDILAFIGRQPGKVGTRELARAFGLKNDDRAALKRILRELADDGHVERRRKKLHHAGALPTVVLADINGRDADGELIATPQEWDEDAHGPAPKIRIQAPRKARPGEVAGVGDRVLVRTEETGPDADPVRYTGRVIKIIAHPKHRALGLFRALPNGGGRLVPVSKKDLREVTIPVGATLDAQDGDLVAVEVSRQTRFGSPVARVKERLGSLASEKAVSLSPFQSHEIPSVFGREALPRQKQRARPPWRAGGLAPDPLVTIDPVDAGPTTTRYSPAPTRTRIIVVASSSTSHCRRRPLRAARLRPRSRGHWRATRFISRPGRANAAGTHFQRPMLAGAQEGSRRARGPHGHRRRWRKRSHTFHRVMMLGGAALYPQAQEAIDAARRGHRPAARTVLRPLCAAYALKARAARDPLDLDLPERKILLKPDGTVDRVITPSASRSSPDRRVHDPRQCRGGRNPRRATPRLSIACTTNQRGKIEALREFLHSLDISLPRGGTLATSHFNAVLGRVKGRDIEELVNQVVLRTQSQAEYTAENYGHFGLNLRRYAHFTSPIRRYADLVVHRALIRALKLGSDGLPTAADGQSLGEIAARISASERRAMLAERETADRLIAHFLADRIGATFEGRISGVTRAGLFVKLDGTGADGFVPARLIGAEYFRYYEARHALIGDTSGETYQLGDRVRVRLAEAAPVAGALRFELLSPGRIESKRTTPRRARERERSGERRPRRMRSRS
jgi:ribonuclease R